MDTLLCSISAICILSVSLYLLQAGALLVKWYTVLYLSSLFLKGNSGFHFLFVSPIQRTQRTHDLKLTSYQRRCDGITSHRRRYDVILARNAHWVVLPR